MDATAARKEAYEAVELRYEIGQRYLLNIISEQKVSRSDNISAFRMKALALIDDLRVVNDGLGASIRKNEKLIGLLKECVDDES